MTLKPSYSVESAKDVDKVLSEFDHNTVAYAQNVGKIRTYYQKAVGEYGHDPRALGWSSQFNQEQRFRAFFLGYDWLDRTQVLDVGCGQGDLFGFLEQQGVDVTYLGVDFCEEQLAIARDAQPGAVFEQADVMDFESHEPFDVVVASGLVNHLQDSQMDYFEAVMERLWALTGSVLMVNMLSSQAESNLKHHQLFYYYDPATVLNYCQRLTPYVRLDHSYLVQDFTVILHKHI